MKCLTKFDQILVIKILLINYIAVEYFFSFLSEAF